MRSLSGSAFTDFTEYLPRLTFGILKKKMRHLDLIGWSPDWAELILAPAGRPVSIQLLQINSCGLRPTELLSHRKWLQVVIFLARTASLELCQKYSSYKACLEVNRHFQKAVLFHFHISGVTNVLLHSQLASAPVL